MQQTSTHSRTSAIYIVVAVVLLVLLAGAYYLAREYAAVPADGQPIATEEQSTEPGQISERSASDSQTKPQGSSITGSSENNGLGSTAEGESTSSNGSTSNTSKGTDNAKADQHSQHNQSSNAGLPISGPTGNPGEIASAGPTGLLSTLFAVAGLAAGAVAYWRSRRRLLAQR